MTHKITFAVVLLWLISSVAICQNRLMDKNGKASFFSKAPLENIEAHNEQALSILDVDKGEIAVSILMKGFKFEKALMEEHFNEKYIESDKFPKANFKGKVAGMDKVNLAKDGTYTVDVSGDLTIHGETKPFQTKANLIVKSGAVTGNAEFPIKLADYNIDIPKVVTDNIAKEVAVKVAFNFSPVK